MLSHGQEDKTNGFYGSISHGGHKSDRDDIVRDGNFLETPDRRSDGHGF